MTIVSDYFHLENVGKPSGDTYWVVDVYKPWKMRKAKTALVQKRSLIILTGVLNENQKLTEPAEESNV